MDNNMEFSQFVRRPFVVEAVQITAENIEEVAKLIGHLRVKDGVQFISVDRRIVPNIPRAQIGWWMTRLGDNYRCYNAKVFKAEFLDYESTMQFVFEEAEDAGNAQDEAPPHGIARFPIELEIGN